MTSALDIAKAWGAALGDFDEPALLSLAHEEIEIVTLTGRRRGRGELEEWLERQAFGVAPRYEPHRVFVRGDRVVVGLRVEYRYMDGGDLANATDGAAAFVIEDGLVRRLAMHPGLEPALADAGLEAADETEVA